MAYSGMSAYFAALQGPRFWRQFYRHAPIGNSANQQCSLWLATTTNPGANPSAPSTAVAVDNTATGAMIPDLTDAGSTIYLADCHITRMNSNHGGTLLICDRLTHQGGLAGNVAPGAQTTNLPTAALTRYTSGVGVLAAVEIYTGLGGTGTTFTTSYTNQAGAAGQISDAVVIGTGTQGAPGAWLPIPLVAGDTGVRSVESVTLAATTGVAGNFGVTLYRPLALLRLGGGIAVGNSPLLRATWNALFSGAGSLPQLVNGAHLMMVYRPTTSPGSGGIDIGGELTAIT